MSFKTFLFIALLIILTAVTVVISVQLIMKILVRNRNKIQKLTIDELFDAIAMVVTNEISLYERNVLDNKGKIVSNASYENYYKDIMKNVCESLSDDVIDRLSFYINRQSIFTWISREIKIYLNNKIMWKIMLGIIV